MTPEERLATLLDERDEEISRLRRKVEELEQAAENRIGTTAEWALPRIIEDEHPELPLPRLEVVFRPSRYDDGTETWGRTVIEYRMVRCHLLGHVEVTPMGRTERSGSDKPPWAPSVDGAPPRWVVEEGLDPEAWRIGYVLPYRDGAHAVHDAAHLAMPLYVQTDRGMERLDHLADISHKGQRTTGAKHRRGQDGALRSGAVAESLLTALLGLVVRWEAARTEGGRRFQGVVEPWHADDLRTVIHAYFEPKAAEPVE